MAHPCASSRPPAWCTRKKKRSTHTCSCPAGWTRTGIMCRKRGHKTKHASCRKRSR